MTIPDPGLVDRLMAVWLDPPADDAAGVAAFRALYTDPVDVNGNPGRPAGQCHREQTASRIQRGVRVKRWCKRPPAPRVTGVAR